LLLQIELHCGADEAVIKRHVGGNPTIAVHGPVEALRTGFILGWQNGAIDPKLIGLPRRAPHLHIQTI
jgi:hypothetical protein